MRRIPLLILACLSLAGCVNDLKVQTIAYKENCLKDFAYRHEIFVNDMERDKLVAWTLNFEAANSVGDDAVQALCSGLKQSIDRTVRSKVNNAEPSDE